MIHHKNCKFKEKLNELKDEFFIGEGEISGHVSIDENKITFNDGWNNFPNINFNYCPECGKKLKQNKKTNKL